MVLITNTVQGQERVKPSKTYPPGDTIISPLYGIKMIVPEHWYGFLTRGTEVFTLESDTAGGTTILMYPSEESLKDIETRWQGKVEFSPGVELIPESKPQINDGFLQSAFGISGNDNRKGFAYAECGEFGFCYTAFVIVDHFRANSYRKTLSQLAKNLDFFEPTITEFYGDFDWTKELSGKYMVTYESGGGSTKQNHLWLCPDGTFESRITRKGGLKGTTGPYKGKLKGTYVIEGVGHAGMIQLNFEKLTPLQLPLEIKDEVVFMNGLRYSISDHNQCK